MRAARAAGAAALLGKSLVFDPNSTDVV